MGGANSVDRLNLYQKTQNNLGNWHHKGKPLWILREQEMVGWQWHQLDHMQPPAPRSTQITTPVPHHSAFTRRMPSLPPNQQGRSTVSIYYIPHYWQRYLTAVCLPIFGRTSKELWVDFDTILVESML